MSGLRRRRKRELGLKRTCRDCGWIPSRMAGSHKHISFAETEAHGAAIRDDDTATLVVLWENFGPMSLYWLPRDALMGSSWYSGKSWPE